MGPLRLQPGLHVVRRDDHHVQVGLDPPWRVLAPDEPEVRRLLGDLAEGRPAAPGSPAAHRTLAALLEAGMLVAQHPPDEARQPAGHRVAVHATREVHADLVRALRQVGCDPDPEAPVALVAAAGEVRRTEADQHQRDGRPHQLLSATARGWSVGPFVLPGATACLRCVDAHRAERDPRRALVVDQLAGRAVAPPDPLVATIAAAWAVRDLLTFLEGGEPSTWSSTVELGPDLRPRRHPWRRHPHCGCAWTWR